MAQIKPMKVPPRPVAPPDLGDTRWRRFVDALLFRRGLRQRLSDARDEIYAAYLEVEAANDRRTEGASAAHTGMFRIESLGIIESEVVIRKERRFHERLARVTIGMWNSELQRRADEREVVAFEGQAYIIDGVAHQREDDYGYHGGGYEVSGLIHAVMTLELRGVILNGR